MENSPSTIHGLRAIHDSDGTRLVFQWPLGAEYIHITQTPGDFPLRLITAQEYKRRGGVILPRVPGVFTFTLTHGDAAAEITCQTGQTTIFACIRRKWGWGKYATHALTLSADHPVPENTLQYIKQPADGVVYFFTEPLTDKPLTRHIQTNKHETITLQIADEASKDLYILKLDGGRHGTI